MLQLFSLVRETDGSAGTVVEVSISSDEMEAVGGNKNRNVFVATRKSKSSDPKKNFGAPKKKKNRSETIFDDFKKISLSDLLTISH